MICVKAYECYVTMKIGWAREKNPKYICRVKNGSKLLVSCSIKKKNTKEPQGS